MADYYPEIRTSTYQGHMQKIRIPDITEKPRDAPRYSFCSSELDYINYLITNCCKYLYC